MPLVQISTKFLCLLTTMALRGVMDILVASGQSYSLHSPNTQHKILHAPNSTVTQTMVVVFQILTWNVAPLIIY